MRSFILLCKMNLKQFLNSLNKKSVSTYVSILMAILLTGGIIAFSTYMNYTIYKVLDITGNLNNYISVVSSMALMIIIITSLTKVKGTIYGNKDYNLLKTLPINNKPIIAYKIFSIYVSELKFSLFALAPSIGILIYYNNINVLSCLTVISAMFLIPIAPILVFGLLGLLFSLIFERIKYSAIISSVLSLVLIAALYLLIYIPKSNETASNIYVKLYEICKYVDPLLFLINRSFDGFTSSLVLFVGINVVASILFIIVTSLTYDKINMSIESRSYKKDLNYKYKSKDAAKSIYGNEIKRIISSSNVLVNVLMGPLMACLVTIIFYFSFKGAEGGMDVLPKIAPIFAVFSVMMFGISPYTAYSISLEGESFWIIKTIPVPSSTIFKQKIKAALVFTLPMATIAPIVAIFLYKLSIPIAVLLVLIYISFNVFSCIAGLLFNLEKANIHFKNEIEAIKKGSSSLKMLFTSFLGIVVFILIIIFIGIKFNMIIAYSLILFICIVAIIVSIFLLNKYGEKLFNKIV